MFLRAYRPEDKQALQQLFFLTVHTVNDHDYTPAQLAVWAPVMPDRRFWSQLDDQICFVVENQRLPVGFISVAADGALGFLYVHPDFQGKGIASALYKQVERLARKRGFGHLEALASITARLFFQKKGFLFVEEVRETRQNVHFLHYKMAKSLLLPDAAAKGLERAHSG